jgi:peroxiredoxin
MSLSVNALNINRPVPICNLKSMDNGQTYNLQQFRGQVIYVDFWASWCTSCLVSFPFMNQLNADLKENGLQVIAINMDETSSNAEEFLRDHTAKFNIATDTNEQCAKAFALKAMPSSYLVDRNGMIRYEHIGFKAGEIEQLLSVIKQLLAEPTPAH